MLTVNGIRGGEIRSQMIDDRYPLGANRAGEDAAYRAEQHHIMPAALQRAGEIARVDFRASPLCQRVIGDQDSHAAASSARTSGSTWSANVIIVW